jgi:O-acetyl-ADP-ribose deacetylase (regulator of RNase III)
MVLLMIKFTQGNLLDANAEALVNTVNTVGVMGKGIALMFKDAFPENFKAYQAACKKKQVTPGGLFITSREQLIGPKWIINFATKDHWRSPSKIEWVREGLDKLKSFVVENNIKSIALPPLGSGNGGLEWSDVRNLIEQELGAMTNVDIVVYEPTRQYQNIAKRTGVEKLTPARALISEGVRRYTVIGIECSLLEVQKLAYFIELAIKRRSLQNPFQLNFDANKFGPYAAKLTHLLDALDGSYLHCGKRLADAGPSDVIWFEEAKRDKVATFIDTEAKEYAAILDETSTLIDGFESPLGMELLSTIDWLLRYRKVEATNDAIRRGLSAWPGGAEAGGRKLKLFDDRLIGLALDRLAPRSLELI